MVGEVVARAVRAASITVRVAAAAATALVAGARTARAQQAAPITDNAYDIEIHQGPLIAPVRVTGLAGAYTGLGDGIEGTPTNAASPAVREPFSHKWIDVDAQLSVSFPGSFSRTDFDNRGSRSFSSASRFRDFLYVNAGVQVQVGELGLSLTTDAYQFQLDPARTEAPSLSLLLGRWHALAAYGFHGDQLVLGAGFRALTVTVSQQGSIGNIFDGRLLTMLGAAPEVGMLFKPNGQQWRLGGTVRSPVTAAPVAQEGMADAQGVRRAGRLVLPSRFVQPWEVELGGSLQLGPRPLNPPFLNPRMQEAAVREATERAREARAAENARLVAVASAAERAMVAADLERREKAIREVEVARLDAERRRLGAERRARYLNWPREHILVVASVLVAGASKESVAVESFLDQRREAFGRSVTVTPRAGVEGEPVVNWVKIRMGSYVEPSRFEFGVPRQHFTAGADFKLFPFDLFGLLDGTTWRASFAADIAPRYSNWGFSLGLWH